MQEDAEAHAKLGAPFPFCPHFFGVPAQHLVVIGKNNGFLTRKIVVGGAGGDFGGLGNVPHGGDFEAAFPKQFQSSLQDQRLGIFDGCIGVRSIGTIERLEHVQMLWERSHVVKKKMNMFTYFANPFCFLYLVSYAWDAPRSGECVPTDGVVDIGDVLLCRRLTVATLQASTSLLD